MVHTGYNPALVALSLAIAVFASYTALDLAGRMRGSARGPRWAWVAGAALAMGGGIWSMHFVGMLAFEMGMPAAYDLGLTLASLLIAVGATGAAFVLISRPGAGLRDILVGGPLMGVGVAGMHYTGMAAMRVLGNLAYSLPVVALSVAIAVSAATAALWLTFRQHGVGQKLAAAFVMGLAVAGMHYTGMAAATFTAEAAGAHAVHVGGVGAGQQNLALAVGGATFLILFLAMLASSIDQQRVQRELQASEARFRAAVQAVRGVLWTNDAEGRMVGEQPGWAALTGQTPEAYAGFGWASAVHPDDVAPSVAAWNATVAARRPFVHEHRVRAQDGAWRHFAIRAVPVLDDRGGITEWVGVHTDITEQREAEGELLESNEELQRYAYIVSHDLRSPLVNVMGFTSELEEARPEIRRAMGDHPDAERIDRDLGEALGFIRAAVTRMEGLIAAILKLSREGRRRFAPEPLALTSLLQSLADAQRHQIETAGATVSVAPDLPTIVADRLAVEQVVGNLIDNAVKYLDAGRPGRIAITARPAVGNRVRIAVTDNGRGIAPRDHAVMLLREVNHRVANSLALVAALTHMQTSAVSDPAAKAALEEMQARISAIAGIHRRLYTSDDVEAVALDAYLASLVEELQAAMRASGRDHAIRLSADPVRLATDKAVSVGVVVTELVTNAYKYAYPVDAAGEIRVELRRRAEDTLELAVEDDGIGWTGEGRPRGTGLGSRIVRAMATNLRSGLCYVPDRVGTRAVLSFRA